MGSMGLSVPISRRQEERKQRPVERPDHCEGAVPSR